MPSEVTEPELSVKPTVSMQKMDKKNASPFVASLASSLRSTEVQFPVERQVGFWRREPAFEKHGVHRVSSITSNGVVSSAALGLNGTVKLNSFESSQSCPTKELEIMFDMNSIESERSSILSSASWRTIEQKLGAQRNVLVSPTTVPMEGNKLDFSSTECESGLFSSSLSGIFEKKLIIPSCDDALGHPIITAEAQFEDNDPFASLEEMEARILGNLLPDDDELFSGVIDGFGHIPQTSNTDEMEEFDLFSSIGGLELEVEDGSGCYGNKGSDIVCSMTNGQQFASNGAFAGEHPFGEHPSRTLFVRNINSNVEDTELRCLFERYGDIRALYTACKHRGFVMVAYYDIRSARNAMRSLQNKPLRRRKLDIHFSIPKDHPSEKDINQGTLVVFNLDPSVSNDNLKQIFGAYGEIKEIRETPHKQHHKFIEFYDVRAAEAALRALNRSDIAGKRIKLEPSRPGGARRLMQQLSQDLELDEASLLRQQGSPSNNLPLSFYGSHSSMSVPVSCNDNGAIKGHASASCPIDNQFVDPASVSISSAGMIPGLSPPGRVPSIHNTGSHPSFVEANHSMGQMNGLHGLAGFHPHSLPEYHIMGNSMPYNSPSTVSPMTTGNFPRHAEETPCRTIHNTGLNGLQSHSFENGNGFGAMDDRHLMWSNPSSYQAHVPGHVMWPNSTSFANGIHGNHHPQLHGLSSIQGNSVNTVLPSHYHHVGSAPTSIWDRQHAFAADPSESPVCIPGSLGSMSLSNGLRPLEAVAPNSFSSIGKTGLDTSISAGGGGLSSSNHRSQTFSRRDFMMCAPPLFGSPNDRLRGRRSDTNNQADNKKQYELDIDRIFNGEDTRTTLMIKNIPNKYTSKMLLAAIDERHRGTYDFIYLPIDFKNKCNVGYAFINMIDALHIVPFYETFNGKKWEKFNSEKVASLAYARIQGKAALIAHFQNSSLMNEDKRCRPILFHTDGPNAGDQEPFPVGLHVRSRSGKPRAIANDDNQASPSSSPPREEAPDVNEASAGSTKDGQQDSSSD